MAEQRGVKAIENDQFLHDVIKLTLGAITESYSQPDISPICLIRSKVHGLLVYLPKQTIYRHVLDKSKKCLSVCNLGILPVIVVVCLYSRSCLHKLMQRPGIFTKSWYIILIDSNGAGFFSNTVFCYGVKTLPYV